MMLERLSVSDWQAVRSERDELFMQTLHETWSLPHRNIDTCFRSSDRLENVPMAFDNPSRPEHVVSEVHREEGG